MMDFEKVHHDGTSERTVLMVDIWHPEATDEMKAQFSQASLMLPDVCHPLRTWPDARWIEHIRSV